MVAIGIVLISFIPLGVCIELGYKGNCKFFEDLRTLESLFKVKGWIPLTHSVLGTGTTLESVEHLPERNEHETHSNQIISMDRFRFRYFK